MRALGILVALLLAAAAPARGAGEAVDRLARFRELGLLHADGMAAEPAAAARLADELYALVDAEVLDNLASGGPFASPAFIAERLEALGNAWGGMSLRLAPTTATRIVVAVLGLAGDAPSGSLRFYAMSPAGPRLVATATHPGRPEAYPWPAAAPGTARLAASWVGAGAPAAGQPLWVEVWELRGERDAAPVWRTAARFPDGLVATGFALRPGRLVLRYPAAYPGYKPGCRDQTEHEEVFAQERPSGRIALASRRVAEPWHRELSAAVERLVAALEAGDRRALAAAVPDAGLRARLPARLRPEGACDERLAGGRAALVAVTEPRGDALRPWSLRFARTGGGWRLTAASPVLQ